MKFSIILSAILLAIFGLLGWQTQTHLSSARKLYEHLVSEAETLGISTFSPRSATSSSSRRDRPDREIEVQSTTKDLLELSRKLDRRSKQETDGEEDGNLQLEILEIMDRVAALDAEQIKTLIATLRADSSISDLMRQALINFAIMTLSEKHPQKAIQMFTLSADIVPDGRMAQHTLSSALARWAKESPESALAWVRENQSKFPDLITDTTKTTLISGVVSNDPKLAFSLIGELGLNGDASTFNYLIQALKNDHEKTAFLQAMREHASQAGSSSDTAVKAALLRLGDSFARGGFESANAWLTDAKLTNKELTAFASGLPDSIKDGEQTKWIGWMEDNLSTNDAAHTIFSTVANWTRNDYRAVGEWLTSAEEGVAKTQGIRAYSMEVAAYDPVTAEQWALTIPPGKNRNTALRGVHAYWPKSDPEGAAAFAKKHGLSTD